MMLFASGPIGPGTPFAIVSFPPRHRPALSLRSALAVCRFRHVVPAVGPVRRLGWLRGSPSQRLAVPRGPKLPAAPLSLSGCRSGMPVSALGLPWRPKPRVSLAKAFPGLHSSLPMAARLSLHLRFAGLCPKTSRGVFSDAAAGIAVTPIRLNFTVPFQVVKPEKVRRILR